MRSRLLLLTAVVLSTMVALPSRGANILITPENPAQPPWMLGDQTSLRGDQPSNGAILETRSPFDGGTSQCVITNLPPPGTRLDGAVTVTIVENAGGVRGFVLAFPTPDCSGPSLAGTQMEPPVDTRENPPNTPMRMSGSFDVVAGTQSVKFNVLAFTLNPAIPFAFGVADPVLDAVDAPPPPPPPDVVIAALDSSLRSGDAEKQVFLIGNAGNGPTMGPITITISAPGLRLGCPDPSVRCMSNGTSEIVITLDQTLDPDQLLAVQITVDADATLPGTYDIMFAASGGGDPLGSTDTATVRVEPPRAADFPQSLDDPALVDGRGHDQ